MDHLTKLNNRRKLHDFCAIPSACPERRCEQYLDNFKQINDQYGHDRRRQILVVFVNIYCDNFNPENIFRLGVR